MFQTFHRHRKQWLTALTLMAMVAFAFPLTSTYFGGSDRSRRPVEVVDTIFQKQVTNADIERARLERLLANTFFMLMIDALYPQMGHMFPPAFGPTQDDEAIKDAIRMAHKADELGIRVTDDMIRNWISQETLGKLTTEQFEQAVARVGRQAQQLTGERGLSAETLFDILRKQLRILQVQSLVTGRFGEGPTPATPFESWQLYRKLNDKFGLEVMPVAVADFAAQIEDPGDAELRKLYDEHIESLPVESSPEPGFKEPHRVNLQYASVTLNAFESAIKSTLDITEEEIKQYYDSHKESYRIPGEPPAQPPVQVPENPAAPEPQEPANQAPDESKKSEPKESATPDKKVEPNTTPPDDPKPAQNNSERQNDATDKPSGPHESPPQEPTTQRLEDESKPVQQTSDKSQADADSSQEQTKPESGPERGKDAEGDSEKPAEKPDKPLYKPIEDVTPEIRDILTRDKARAELIKRLNQLGRAVNDFGKLYATAQDKFDEEKLTNPAAEFAAPRPPDFAKTAEELGLKFSETGLTSLDDEQFKSMSIGQAIEPAAGRSRGRTVAEVMSTVDFYEPHEFQNLLNDEYFRVWKIEDVPEQQPSYEKIRGKVLHAFQMKKARDLARDRASKLAESLRELQGDMQKLRETQSGFESITIPPTALWSTAPNLFPSVRSRPRRVTTELTGLRFPSEELRTMLFELQEGEVTVAPNEPQDIYYVVLVAKRQMASREDFARSRQFIEMQAQSEQAEKMATDWLLGLRKEAAGDKR
jgi:hypothetical protein